MTRTAVLVGCGAKKRDGPAAAKDLYTSTYFQKKRAVAETVGEDWRILSAKHRLWDPDRWLRPYDRSMDDVEDTDHWAAVVGSDLTAWLNSEFDEPVELLVLAGRDYVDSLRPVIGDLGLDAKYPFDGTSGIGEQLQWLTERYAAATEVSS